jgi:hypothetical protein
MFASFQQPSIELLIKYKSIFDIKKLF